MTIGEKLKEARKKKGYSMADVHEKTGLACSGISAIELGKRNCNSTTLQILANLYGISTDYLLGDEIEQPEVVTGKLIDSDGSITEMQVTLINKTNGFTVDDFIKVLDYVDYVKSKKKENIQ